MEPLFYQNALPFRIDLQLLQALAKWPLVKIFTDCLKMAGVVIFAVLATLAMGL